MRCVKDTLPPRERARWLLITMRLSTRSLAGTARTLVAVGTVSEAFMFLTTAAAAPRSGVRATGGRVGGVFVFWAAAAAAPRSGVRTTPLASAFAGCGLAGAVGAAGLA